MTGTAGDRLHDLRIAAGFEKREPCAREIGINANSMAQHELGLRQIGPKVAERYAAFFGVPASFILFGEKQPELPAATAVDVARVLLRAIPRKQHADVAEFLLALGKAVSAQTKETKR
jgi:hypothetical protein